MTEYGPILPSTVDRNVPHDLRTYRGPFIMGDGMRCRPSLPGVRAARYSRPATADLKP